MNLRHFGRRLWRRRPLLLYAVVFVIVLLFGYSFIANGLVARYERETPRDAEGYLLGGAPVWAGPEDAARAILLIHGFSGTPASFADLPQTLAERGWRVYAPLLPGHGTRPSEMERTTADDYRRGVRAAYEAISAQYPMVVVLGHSMGGALATGLTAALSRPPAEDEVAPAPPAGLILVEPYFRIYSPWFLILSAERWTNMLHPALRWVYSPNSANPVYKPGVGEKIISYEWIPSRAGLEAIKLAKIAGEEETLAAITCPVLVIHSDRDRVTAYGPAQEAFARIASTEKRFVTLHESNHIPFWDYDAEATREAIVAFLDTLTTPEAVSNVPAPETAHP